MIQNENVYITLTYHKYCMFGSVTTIVVVYIQYNFLIFSNNIFCVLK